jgi:signal transduction histidine kinase
MDQSSDRLPAALPQPRAHQMRPTRGPPASNGWVPAGRGDAGAAGPSRELAGERDRIAQHLTEVVVHRLFAAGLDLQAALGLIGDHPGADRIGHAIGELDRAITDLRDAIFDHAPATAASHPGRGHG